MSDTTRMLPKFEAFLESGEGLRDDIDEHLKNWPVKDEKLLRGDEIPDPSNRAIEELDNRGQTTISTG